MEILDYSQILLLVDAVLFVLGVLTFIIGIMILASKAMSRDVRTISAQTAKLVQKGIAEDISGLVGNASALMNALALLVRTATGIGVFLVILGVALIGSSIFIFININNFNIF